VYSCGPSSGPTYSAPPVVGALAPLIRAVQGRPGEYTVDLALILRVEGDDADECEIGAGVVTVVSGSVAGVEEICKFRGVLSLAAEGDNLLIRESVRGGGVPPAVLLGLRFG
jgi:hypothetical protein